MISPFGVFVIVGLSANAALGIWLTYAKWGLIFGPPDVAFRVREVVKRVTGREAVWNDDRIGCDLCITGVERANLWMELELSFGINDIDEQEFMAARTVQDLVDLITNLTEKENLMAKKPKGNGIDGEVAKEFLERIEGLYADLDSERGSYMNACKAIREDIAEAYSQARERGIPVKALKAEVKTRELKLRIENIKSGLDIDERSAFEQLQEALGGLGELPLGQASMDAQRRRDAAEFDEEDDEEEQQPVGEPIGDESPEDAADRTLAQIGDRPSTEQIQH